MLSRGGRVRYAAGDSEFKGQASYENVLSLANSAKGSDSEGYRSEFVQLVKKASLLAMN
ncbi:DUF3520 domain-containing protein [candidate division KSB1 bacterium]|nr:DUF3520 domain-containing protein [candidate division KSB1 bacterium]